jgi:hypothetical protein
MFDDDPGDECRYPTVDGLSGYRYGCRCSRCSEAKARWRHPSAQCVADGCEALRLKHRRWCVEHVPPPRPSLIRSEAKCELCGRVHSWYESTVANIRPEVRDLYRRTCPGCRNGYMRAIQNHRLDTAWALRLIVARECELCGARFAISNTGRRYAEVDHNHGHCEGQHSCGACVRGIICPRCNHVLGSLEHAERTIGLTKLFDYLAGLRREVS